MPKYATLQGYEQNIEWSTHRWCGDRVGESSRHSGFDWLRVTENGQVSGGEEHLDAARDAWLAADVAEALQREDHLMHGRRAELEMALHVGLGRGTAVDAGIGRRSGPDELSNATCSRPCRRSSPILPNPQQSSAAKRLTVDAAFAAALEGTRTKSCGGTFRHRRLLSTSSTSSRPRPLRTALRLYNVKPPAC